jgi:hypothetical protein
MRTRWALVVAAAAGIAGCGGDDDHANRARPPATINVTAAIADGRVLVSPRSFGAGPIRLIVSNQTTSAQAVTVETGGNAAGVTQTSAPITPAGTGTLELDLPEGDYEVSTDDGRILPAAVTVGAPRPSAQQALLQP